MLASTALVLMMTIPGLALFYAGMVRKKNVLATMMQSFIITCLVTVVWMVAGYSLAFTKRQRLFRRLLALLPERHRATTGTRPSCWRRHRRRGCTTTIPETVYMMFQMTFAIITPALIAGAFADRMKFSAHVRVHGAVVAAGLLADRALGVERRPAGSNALGAARLRRRHGGAHQRRHRRPGLRAGAGQAARLRHATTWRRTTWPTP